MKETDIRPQELMRQNRRFRKADLKRLLLQKQKFVSVACPACGRRKYQRWFSKDGFDFVRCTRCQTAFINPRPTLAILENFYTTARSIKHWNDAIFPASEQVRRRTIFKPRALRVVQMCKKYGVGERLLIDVGAGFGTFCEEMQRLHYFTRVVAIEPAPGLAQTCRQKGVEVIEAPVEATKISGADVITNFELIEHLFDPKEFLTACARSLRRKGLLILTTPNIQGFDITTLGNKSDHLAGPNHLNYFHPQSLKLLAETCGFRVLEITTPGKLDAEVVRNKVLANKFRLTHQPFLQQILIDRWDELGRKFQQFLRRHTLSSHMWLVAMKR